MERVFEGTRRLCHPSPWVKASTENAAGSMKTVDLADPLGAGLEVF
jgi:hypothetical protein